MQYHAIPCHTMQYHAISCNTMQYHAIPCNTMHYHAIPCTINNCWRSLPLPCGQYKDFFSSFTYVIGGPLIVEEAKEFSKHPSSFLLFFIFSFFRFFSSSLQFPGIILSSVRLLDFKTALTMFSPIACLATLTTVARLKVDLFSNYNLFIITRPILLESFFSWGKVRKRAFTFEVPCSRF